MSDAWMLWEDDDEAELRVGSARLRGSPDDVRAIMALITGLRDQQRQTAHLLHDLGQRALDIAERVEALTDTTEET